MSSLSSARSPGTRRWPYPWIWLILTVVLGFFLFTEHRAHLLGIAPYLLILLCPLMHFFMHGKHSSHGHHHREAPGHGVNRGDGHES